MAQGVSSNFQQQDMAKEEEQRLKYLEFVQVAAVHAVLCFTNLYVYAKERSGPLKSGVETVEGTVKTVVRPVYDKYHDVPVELLKFVDRKVDESVTKIDRRVPPVIKQVSSEAISAAQKAPLIAWGVASDVQRAGMLPLFPQVASLVIPTAAYYTDKYNQTVVSSAEKGYKVASYLPLVPTQKIAKVFTEEKPESEPLLSKN
ncbi:hypothetical protein REPUB_Repub06bG0013400 [Reevesia pubescens]